MTSIRARNIAFSYGAVREHVDAHLVGEVPQPFLDIADLELRAGSVSVLTGENGCGKTTLLKVLAGLLVPSEGVIDTGLGTPVFVHQRPYLFAESVQANVAWPLKIRRVPRQEIRSRVDYALEQVGLTSFARRWAPSLSGGEKQRAAIARALVLEPAVLLLDEPTSNIDTLSVTAIESVLRALAQTGTTVVMSTHNQASAYRLADKLLPMAAGRLMSPRLNILPGTVIEPGDAHIGQFAVTGSHRIFCPAATGNYSRAVIRMEDIILSPEQMASSAQNHLPGTIRAVEPAAAELVRVDLDCGFPLTSLVTQRSVDELKLVPGIDIYATFKASAVRLY